MLSGVLEDMRIGVSGSRCNVRGCYPCDWDILTLPGVFIRTFNEALPEMGVEDDR